MKAEIKELFDSASRLPSHERPAYLMQSCPDPAVRVEVQSLLQYATGTDSLFDAAVREVASSLRAEGELSPGDRIGAYRILSFIGHGGMGTVYLAERADGTFQQQVAAKVLQSGDTTFLLERFWQERRILALLNHPNIAHLLDAGQTSDGLPWFVMEYVPGQAIDRYCDRNDLPINRRLELFLRVCDAVRHAHQSLIVHRDLKPANILVNEDGEPKLLDFGIAKMLDPTNVDTATTRLLTPDYASPEQIRGDPITTATDIYSLGAVLYKVLTGRPPHSLSGTAPLSAARIITDKEVTTASTVCPGLPGDVDSILRKALHKDPVRRYHSVEEFARDIRLYLQGRPVLAVPDSFAYRASRYLKRNALILALSAIVAVLLSTATWISINQARRAQHRFQQVRQLANVFLFDFDQSLVNIPGTLDSRKLVAATARRYLEQLATESSDDVDLQREIAVAYERLGAIQHDLQSSVGNESEIESLRRAYEIRHRLGDGHAVDVTRRKEFILLASRLAGRYQTAKNASESVRWDEEATGIAASWVREHPELLEALEAASTAFMSNGLRLEAAGQAAQSREAMAKAVRLGERARSIARDHSNDHNLVKIEFTFANMLLNLKEPAEALLHAERAVELSEQLYRLDQRNQKWRRAYQQSLSSAGIVRRALAGSDPRHLPNATQSLQQAHSLAWKTAQEDPKNVAAKDDLIVQSHRLAGALLQSGKPDAAASLYEQAGQVIRDVIAINPQNRRYWYLSAANQVHYAGLRLHQGQFRKARDLLLSADAPFERALSLDPFDATLLEVRASQFQMLAAVAGKVGDRTEARFRIRQCLEVVNAMIERDPLAKEYIGDYKQMIALARRLGVSTGNLPDPAVRSAR